MTRNQLASASLPASLNAVRTHPSATARGSTPAQSMRGVSVAVDSLVNTCTATTAMAHSTAMVQNTER